MTSYFLHRRMRFNMRRDNLEQTSFYTYIKLAADDFLLDTVTERLGVESLDIDDVLNPLYDLFNPKVDIINALKEQYDLSVHIAVVIEIENGCKPGFTISPAFSHFASSLDAEIDIDLYAYPFSEVEHD